MQAKDQPDTRLLSEWRNLDAYVLLGEPGAGKSESFFEEARDSGGHYMPVRNFITLGAKGKPQPWFLDGLDEIRSGSHSGHRTLADLLAKLAECGTPRFRISCREADWFGATDQADLAVASPNQTIKCLSLDPLDEGDIKEIFRQSAWPEESIEDFLERAELHGIRRLLNNPLMLALTIKSVGDDDWPKTRTEVFEKACRHLLIETSRSGRQPANTRPGQLEGLFDAAGKICAMLVLSGKDSISVNAEPGIDTLSLSELPPQMESDWLNDALNEKAFIAIGGERRPRHRTIAEFLAGKFIAKTIERDGLPITRVLALMQGFDGRPVEPMRGLYAWLLTSLRVSTSLPWISLDPIGLVLNGDIAQFNADQKRKLIEALRNEARTNRIFRKDVWVSHPFAGLATQDMEQALLKELQDFSIDESHQIFITCLLDALCHGEKIPGLASVLEQWILNPQASEGNRIRAYQAYRHSVGANDTKAMSWLNTCSADGQNPASRRMVSEMLSDLYPGAIPAEKVFDYLDILVRPNDEVLRLTFWDFNFFEQTRTQDWARLADALYALKCTRELNLSEYTIGRVVSETIKSAIEASGDDVGDETLYHWLSLAIDRYGSVHLEQDSAEAITNWFKDKPSRYKAIFSLAAKNHTRTFPSQWLDEQLLSLLPKPEDWWPWLLDFASQSPTESIARQCFQRVAYEAIENRSGSSVPSIEKIEEWVQTQSTMWPKAQEWLDEIWTCPLESWQAKHHSKKLSREEKESEERAKRKVHYSKLIPGLLNGQATLGIWRDLANAYNGLYSDIAGSTPEQRLQNLLVADFDTALKVIEAIPKLLAKENFELPEVENILELDRKGRMNTIRPAALLAAALGVKSNPSLPAGWSKDMAQKLTAFYLTDGMGGVPSWYKYLCVHRPSWVAQVFYPYAKPRLRKNLDVRAMRTLGDPEQKELIAELLPQLISAFPLRSNAQSRRLLNGDMLTLLKQLDVAQAANIVQAKLGHAKLDSLQRICWWVASLAFDPLGAGKLLEFVGNEQLRITTLSDALSEQGITGQVSFEIASNIVFELIRILAPFAPPSQDVLMGFSSHHGGKDSVVSSLISKLAADPRPEARQGLIKLLEVSNIGAWADVVKTRISEQRAIARETYFECCSPKDAALTLLNLAPANALDLRATLIDHLRQLEAEWRGTDTYLVRSFWENGKPHEEERCRDVIIDGLRHKCEGQGIRLIPEARAAAQKRIDFRAEIMRAGKSIRLPVEIKKENHRDLWTAWRDQLKDLYTNDPASQGYCIYLVLWFGAMPEALRGKKPKSAQEMHDRLVGKIPETDQALISVVVLDLSMPKVPDR